MATTSPLPANWVAVLDKIQGTLTQTIQLADTREASLPHFPNGASSLLSPDFLTKNLEELHKRGQGIEAPLIAFDQTLQIEEEHVRQHLAMVADLRKRLADWAGRAVK